MTLTIGILSWGAHNTLHSTLQSYQQWGLDRLGDERVIFFQEISEEDKSIARQYGYEYIGADTNIGIAQGYASLVNYATSDLFLFLENDWLLLSDPEDQIFRGKIQLLTDWVDVVRYRSRRDPGNPLWTRQFLDHEYDRPTHLLDSAYYRDDPEKFPEITKMGDWYFTSSKYANWTNNPTMFRVETLKEHILTRIGDGDAERDLQGWWEQQDFIVSQGDGLFKHYRIG